MSYPDVHIVNSTKYPANGTVHYMSIFCSNDDYHVDPGQTWEHSRGVCLITKIDAELLTPGWHVQGEPYESSGTSYSQFAIIETGPRQFKVTRVVTGSEDEPPDDYEEPTSEQK
jgi:hypothetical protein